MTQQRANPRAAPTHTLRIDVPLNLTDAPNFDYYPVEIALRVVMAVTRLAVDGVCCGDVNVSISEVDR